MLFFRGYGGERKIWDILFMPQSVNTNLHLTNCKQGASQSIEMLFLSGGSVLDNVHAGLMFIKY